MSETSDLDPDALAELEAEQAFLLRSLDDLDAEYGAGDLDPADFDTLNDDYTRRLAEVTRAIDERREAFAEVDNRLGAGRRALVLAAVAVGAIVVGMLLAGAVGYRSPTDSVSGGIRQSSTGLLAEADTLTREGRWPEAIAVYDQAIDQSPANVEALTYRGWLSSRTGDDDTGLGFIDEAIAVDGDYPDARVFRAIIMADSARFDEAADELAILDTLDAPDEILAMVQGFGLRTKVAKGQLVAGFGDGSAIDLDRVSGSLDDIAAGAIDLIADDATLAIRALSAVLDEDPNHLAALVAKGNVLGTSVQMAQASPETAAEGLALLNRAVELEPDSDEIRLYRAVSRSINGDRDGAARDLELVDPARLPDELVPAYERFGSELAE